MVITNYPDIERYLRAAVKRVKNCKPVLITIASDFYKDEKQLAMLKGPGRYKDLAESTKISKMKKFGFIYPILKATGRLFKSVTSKDSPDSIFEVSDSHLRIGTTVPYAPFHQSPDSKKYRPFIINSFVRGGFYDKWKVQEARWIKMIELFVAKRWANG